MRTEVVVLASIVALAGVAAIPSVAADGEIQECANNELPGPIGGGGGEPVRAVECVTELCTLDNPLDYPFCLIEKV